MEPCSLLLLLHNFADIQELHIVSMHVHVLSLVLLSAEIGFFEWWLESVRAKILYCVDWHRMMTRLLLSKLILQLLAFVIKVLPNDVSRFLLL